MGQYDVRAIFEAERQYRCETGPFQVRVDFNETSSPGSAQHFLSSLAACKLVSLLELRQKYHMEIEEAEVLISGETGFGERTQGMRLPPSQFKRIDILFRVKTRHTEEEMRKYLSYVNNACTIGNSISEKIEQNYRFEWF